MVGKVKFEARIKELVENLPDLVRRTLSTTSSGLAWKPGRCRNGFAARLPKQSCRWSVLRRGSGPRSLDGSS